MNNNREDEEGKGKIIGECRERDKGKKGKTKGKEEGEKSILTWRERTGDTNGDLTNKGGK